MHDSSAVSTSETPVNEARDNPSRANAELVATMGAYASLAIGN